MTTPNEHAQPLLSLRDIQFAWQASAPPVLVLPALHLAAGERVFISGASGSGKSTLLSLISGVAQPDQGEIIMLGQNLTAMSHGQRDRFRADQLGIVFQLFNLVPYLSITENIVLPCRFSRQRMQRLAQMNRTPEQEAARLLAHLELDQQNLARRPVVELSIGQQQRVAVARALIGQPALIVADEPTSALDEGMSERFIDLLLSETAASNTAVLFVSHDLRLAGQFDRHLRFEQLNQAGAVAQASGASQ